MQRHTGERHTHTHTHIQSITGVFTGAISRCSLSLPRHTKASLSTHFISSEADLPLQDGAPAAKLTQAGLCDV